MPQYIPTAATPSQTISVTLNNQQVVLNIYTEPGSYGMNVDIYNNNAVVLTGVPAQNLNRLIRDAYFGFEGDLIFVDTQGTTNPVYTGLGTRYLLYYLTPTDLTNLGFAG